MRRIRATLLGSTLLASMAVSGLAFAAPASGGVPHADESTPHAAESAPAPKAPRAHAKAVHPGPGRERTIEMQRALTARNLYQGPVDGSWGPKTEAALRNFQTQSGLEATGHLNAATAEKLGLEPDRQPVAGVDPAAPETPARVVDKHGGQAQIDDAKTNVQLTALTTDQAKEMQQRLQLLGYYRGPIDGAVGEGTRSALRQFFQRQADLAQKGVVSNAAIGLFGTEPGAVQPVK